MEINCFIVCLFIRLYHPQIFSHLPSVYRDSLVVDYLALDFHEGARASLESQDVVEVCEEGVRAQEILTVASDHYDLFCVLVCENLILAVKLIFVIELELHPWPNERVLPLLFLQPLLKIDPPVHLRLQIGDKQLGLPCLLEGPHIKGHNIML